MTFTEKFQSLKKSLDKVDTKKLTEDFALQINMTDEDCSGIFYIEYKEGNFSVEPYDYFDNTACVTATSDAIAKLAKGTVSKDLTVTGNEAQVAMLAKAYKKPAAKKTAKKTVAKKEETKKTVASKVAEPKKVAKAETKKVEAKKTEVKKPVETKKVATKVEAKSTTKKASK